MQTRKQSFIEANSNTVLGYIISWALMAYVVPFIWDIPVTENQALGIVFMFTIVSVFRNYIVRRAHNHLNYRGKTK